MGGTVGEFDELITGKAIGLRCLEFKVFGCWDDWIVARVLACVGIILVVKGMRLIVQLLRIGVGYNKASRSISKGKRSNVGHYEIPILSS